MALVGGERLSIHAGLTAVIVKSERSNLSAGVAIDTARVYEELAVDVFNQSVVKLRHSIES